MPVILFNAQPLINFAYLEFLPVFFSYIIFFLLLLSWLNICQKNARKHGYPFHGRSFIYTIPLAVIAYLIGYAWIIGTAIMLKMVFFFIFMMFIFVIVIPYCHMLTYNRAKAKGFLKYVWSSLKDLKADALARK